MAERQYKKGRKAEGEGRGFAMNFTIGIVGGLIVFLVIVFLIAYARGSLEGNLFSLRQPGKFVLPF